MHSTAPTTDPHVSFSTYMAHSVKLALQEAARANGRSIADLTEEACRAWLAERRAKEAPCSR